MGVDAGDRSRGAGAGDLHADRGLQARLRGVRRQAEAGVRGRLMQPTRRFAPRSGRSSTPSIASWRSALARLGRVAASRDARASRASATAASMQRCRALVRELGRGGLDALLRARGRRRRARRASTRARSVSMRETLAWHDGLADFAFAMQGLGSGAISLAGSRRAQARATCRASPRRGDRRVRAVRARGRLRCRGDDSCSARATATHYVLDGDKTWISNGGIADFYCVFARTSPRSARADGSIAARGISAFVVDADDAGLQIDERIDVIAPHPLATLRFEDCRVPAAQLHRRRGRGLQARDAHARRLPHLGRRRGARLWPARARRGARARAARADVRQGSSPTSS